MTPSDIFSHWSNLCRESPEIFDGVAAHYAWILEPSGTWDLVLRDTPTVESRSSSEQLPDLEIRLSDEDFVALVQGSLNPQVAFLSGKIKVAGDISIALRLAPLLDVLRIQEA